MRLTYARSQIRIQQIVEFLLIRGLILLFLISLDRPAFWSCSRKCSRSEASSLCKKVYIAEEKKRKKNRSYLKEFKKTRPANECLGNLQFRFETH